jgi:ribosome-interacting GTPase 1
MSQIAISNTVPLTKIDPSEIKAVLNEYRMNSCAVQIHQPDATIEDFIDVVEGNRCVAIAKWSSPSSCDIIVLTSAVYTFPASRFSTRSTLSRSKN